MAQDNAVMRQSINDYDAVLQAVLAEARRLRVEASHRKHTCAQAVDLQERLGAEVRAQEELRKEGAQLAARNAELLALAQDALAAEGDVERSAFADALAAENAMLWRLIHTARYAHLMSCGPTQVTPQLHRKQRLSLSSRSRGSSGMSSASTHSRASQGCESPTRKTLAFTHDSPPPQPTRPAGDEAASGTAVSSSSVPAEGDQVSGGGVAAETEKPPAGRAAAACGEELTVSLEGGMDEDDLTEVSSLVESAIFLGSPSAEAEAELLTPPTSPSRDGVGRELRPGAAVGAEEEVSSAGTATVLSGAGRAMVPDTKEACGRDTEGDPALVSAAAATTAADAPVAARAEACASGLEGDSFVSSAPSAAIASAPRVVVEANVAGSADPPQS